MSAADALARRTLAAVAVVLLVATAACVAPARTDDPASTDPAVRTALDRTDAAARTALADAVALAVREAARDPPIDPANTTYRRVVRDSAPYRDHLRIRIYLAAHRALSDVRVDAGTVRGRAWLPPARNDSALRAAARRVRLRWAAGRLRVWIRNVTVVVARDGRTARVGRRTVGVTVETPWPSPYPRSDGGPGDDPASIAGPAGPTRTAGDDSHLTRPALVPGMFHEELRDVSGRSVADLRREYAADLAAAVESVGVEAAVDRTGLDRETVESVAGGDVEGLSLADAAAIAALAEGTPDAETIVEIACDHLLLGMSTAVLDVDTVAGNVEADLTPKEVQQKLERRAPMTFEEYVRIQHFVAERQGEAF